MGTYNRKDFYYKKAKREGYRSRAAYKLIELNRRFSIIKGNDVVVDLGCAPGGFLQVASEIVGEKGVVVGIDLLPVVPVGKNVFVVEGDFTDLSNISLLLSFIDGRKFDVLLSDMAPHTSGIHFKDARHSYDLAKAVFNSLDLLLKREGNMVTKIFEGYETREIVVLAKDRFRKVDLTRPDSTRKGSKEIYLVARQFC